MDPLARESPAEREQLVPVDREVANVAARQGGLITHRQLRGLGLSSSAIGRRATSGRLHRVHRGVYAVGHPTLGPIVVKRAALWACGQAACFGFVTGSGLHGLLHATRGTLDVIVPGRGALWAPDNVTIHRTRHLPPEQITTAHGLPVTSVARTLVDIAGVVHKQTLKRAIHEAEVQRTLDVTEVLSVIAQFPTRPGVGVLRHLLTDGEPAPTTDVFVAAYLALCRAYNVLEPVVDFHKDTGLASLGQLDLVYPDHKVIIELDGARTHMTRKQFEEDRRRDSYLAACGWLTLRYTWRRVTGDQPAVAAEVRAVLAQRTAVEDRSHSERYGST